ncbi:MAG: ABC transporter ATP-binding protein [Clostridia bacterium]|nr:ABC transporter ATP-binding protein [Clostridia bacterium]
MEAIKVTSLTKYYGKARGVIDVDLAVNEGDFFGFIGPNGAGKSTTIRTALGLIKPTSGSVSVLGKEPFKDRKAMLSDVGYIPSEAMFYGGMRVSDCIKLSADLRGMDCAEEAKKLCERLSLDTTKKINQLSLGNRKKVAIVCAMQHKPKLYVLDEPTSGLDPLMQKEFFSLLEERNKEGATIFLSSHILSEVERHCKKAAIIREGRIAACDSVDKLGQTNVKRVMLRGVEEIPAMDGIRDMKSEDNSVSFLYNGDVKSLLEMIISLPVADITVAQPDLDEIFMHYYQEGEDR